MKTIEKVHKGIFLQSFTLQIIRLNRHIKSIDYLIYISIHIQNKTSEY